MRVGRYTLGERLGEGGCGAVYRARSDDGRDVAIKILRATNPAAVARFERERRLLASFSRTDGFVPLLDWSGEGATPWLAMPLLAGTLRERLARGPMPPVEARALLRAIAGAMGLAHARGVVHRDLKPENILFGADGEPLVADLGVARHFRADALGASGAVSITQANAFLGTAGYAAPEQLADAARAGPPADVFALGAILYEVLAGRPAFEAPTVLALVERIERGTLPRLDGLPDDLAAIVERALARRPEERYPDALAFARALGAGARPGRPRRRTAAVVALTVLALVAGAAAAYVREAPASLRAAPPRSTPSAPPSIAPPPVAALEGIAGAEAALAATPPRPADAVARAGAILARTPDDARALTVRAKALALLGELDKSLADWRRLDALSPTADGSLRQAAVAKKLHERTGEKSYAEESLRAGDRALVLDPRDCRAWFELGMKHINVSHDYAAAVAAFDAASRNVPAGAEGRYWCALYTAHCGWARTMAGQRDRALADLDRALGMVPDLLLALRWRSEIREASGDVAGAIQDIEAIHRAEESAPVKEQSVLSRERFERLLRKAGRSR